MRAFSFLRSEGQAAVPWHSVPFQSRKPVTVISPESTVQDASATGMMTE
jgi:hypothetical protein